MTRATVNVAVTPSLKARTTSGTTSGGKTCLKDVKLPKSWAALTPGIKPAAFVSWFRNKDWDMAIRIAPEIVFPSMTAEVAYATSACDTAT